jgi:UDP-sugar transporter A1/2/3
MGFTDGGRPGEGPATFFGMPVKQVSLITLTFQNSALILILHYSRIMPPVGDHRYFPSTAVFLCEVLKLAISLTLALHNAARRLLPSSSPPLPNSMPQQLTASAIFQDVYDAVFSKDSWKLAIPAALYTFQNTLLYAAIENLDAVHYQVLYQLKILTTALFTVFLLRRSLAPHRWAALVLLMIGISVVSLAPASPSERPMVLRDASDSLFPRSESELSGAGAGLVQEVTRRAFDAVAGGGSVGVGSRGASASPGLAKRSATYEGIEEDEFGKGMNYALGLSSVLTAAAASGLAGVFLESILKSSHTSYTPKSSPSNANIWTRNIQLAFYSLFAALFGLIWRDGSDIAIHGFFDGYTWIVWVVVVFQASDGLLASLCIQHADNIAKNFATSFSIILSFIFSLIFFEVNVSIPFIIGTSLVLGSAYIYSISSAQSQRLLNHVHRAPKPSPLRLLNFEKRGTIDSLPLHSASGNSTPVSRLTPRLPSFVRVPSGSTPRLTTDDAGFLSVDSHLDSVRAMGLSTSRPASPMISRAPSGRKWDE